MLDNSHNHSRKTAVLRVLKKVNLTAFLSLALFACADTDLDVSVKKQWTESIGNYALRAVYPMRENVHIGTVRLMTEEGEFYGGQSRNYGQINVSAFLATMLNNLPAYAPSNNTNLVSAVTSGDTTYEAWVQPTTAAPRQDRLRLAAFPGISVVRLNSADFATNSLLSALSGAFQERASLDIQLNAIETIELDDVSAFRVFETAFWTRLAQEKPFREALCRSATSMGIPDGQDMQLQMITRVFYARAIDYSYSDKSAAALRAVTGGAVANTVDITNADVSLPQEADSAEVAASAAEVTPGETSNSVNVGSSSSQGLKLRQVFQRPLAFGVDAVAIEPYLLGMRCDGNGGFQVLKDSQMDRYLQMNATQSSSNGWITVGVNGVILQASPRPNEGGDVTSFGPSVGASVVPPATGSPAVIVPFGTPPAAECPENFDELSSLAQTNYPECQ